MEVITATKTKKQIAETNLFFLREITDRLKVKQFNKETDKSCTVLISSPTVSYCLEAIKTVEKYFTKDDWKCKMTHYYKTSNGKFFCYAFKFSK